MHWKFSAALDIIFSTLACLIACAFGNILVTLHFSEQLRPHTNVVAHFMFRALVLPGNLAEWLIPPYWLPPAWLPLAIGLAAVVIAEFILILLSPSYVYRIIVLGVAKRDKIEFEEARRIVRRRSYAVRRAKSRMARRVALVALPRKAISLLVLGAVAGGVAWLITITTNHFHSGTPQVLLACVLILVGMIVYEVIDNIKEAVTGEPEELFDALSELAEVSRR
jgi:hypothetical protein